MARIDACALPGDARHDVTKLQQLLPIGDLPMFDALDQHELNALLGHAVLRRYPAESLLFEEGELPDYLHLILSGTVELCNDGQGGGECGLMLLSSGDLCMPAAVLFAEPYLNSARTLSAARLLLLPAEAVRATFARSHRLAVNMSRILAGHFRMAARHIIDLRCRTAAQRLAAFLLRLTEGRGGSGELPVPKRRLAARLGMTPETLSRTLQVLADNGLVVRGARIEVRDRERIAAFCGPSPYPETSEKSLEVHVL